MTKKNPPGIGRRRAFWTNVTTTARVNANPAMTSSHHRVPPCWMSVHTMRPMNAPDIAEPTRHTPAVTMTRHRERKGRPSP